MKETFRSLTSLKPTSDLLTLSQRAWCFYSNLNMESPKQKAQLLDSMCTLFSTYKQSAGFPEEVHIKASSHSPHSLRSGMVATNKPIIPFWWPHPTSQIQVWKASTVLSRMFRGWPLLVLNWWVFGEFSVRSVGKSSISQYISYLSQEYVVIFMLLWFKHGLAHGLRGINKEL